MKKILALVLAALLLFSLCSCSNKAEEPLDPSAFSTLNDVANAGFEVKGFGLIENIYHESFYDKCNNYYLVAAKLDDEQAEKAYSIDISEDNAREQFLEIFGENEILEITNYELFYDAEAMESYKGMTVSEFEGLGFSMCGYSGADGKYNFDFTKDDAIYVVKIDEKLEEPDDMDAFDASIADYKIADIRFEDMQPTFLDYYFEKYFDDSSEDSFEIVTGDPRDSLETINDEIGCNIVKFENKDISDESYSVIDGTVAQYMFTMDGMQYTVRASKDLSIDLNTFETDNSLIDENGYAVQIHSTTDNYNSIEFLFNDVQYCLTAYDNGNSDYMVMNELYGNYKSLIYNYSEDSKLMPVVGDLSDSSEYAAVYSGTPVSDDMVQATVYIFGENVNTTVWTMNLKEENGRFVYDKCNEAVYIDGEATNNEIGSGYFELDGDMLKWAGASTDICKNFVFTKAE